MNPSAQIDRDLVRDRICKLMQKHRVSNIDLAKELGVTVSAISHWRSGKAIPTRDKLRRLARFFGIQPSELDPAAAHFEDVIRPARVRIIADAVIEGLDDQMVAGLERFTPETISLAVLATLTRFSEVGDAKEHL